MPNTYPPITEHTPIFADKRITLKLTMHEAHIVTMALLGAEMPRHEREPLIELIRTGRRTKGSAA